MKGLSCLDLICLGQKPEKNTVMHQNPNSTHGRFFQKKKKTQFVTIILIKVDALNRVIDFNTHLDDAHTDMDRLKFVFSRIYNHVQMCRKQN